MTERMLRGKAPLTMWRGADGAPGGHLYRGSLLDPNRVDAGDRDRLVAEKFVEVVELDADGTWRLAEDTDTGESGDAVPLGDASVPAGELDPGTINTAATPVAEPEVEAKRADARAKLPVDGSAPDGRAGEAVWVEYAVKQGMDRTEAEKAGKEELRKVLAP